MCEAARAKVRGVDRIVVQTAPPRPLPGSWPQDLPFAKTGGPKPISVQIFSNSPMPGRTKLDAMTLTDAMAYTAKAGSETSNATLTVTIQGHTELVAVDDTGTVTEDATVNTATGNVLTNEIGQDAEVILNRQGPGVDPPTEHSLK